MDSPQPSSSATEVDFRACTEEGYIPAGCLCLFRENEYQKTAESRWDEVRDAVKLESVLPRDLAFVVRLVVARWICLYQSDSTDAICFRVYILPDDVRQATLDRRSRALRTDLGHLCSRIDTSIGAWNGRPRIDSTTKFDLWATGVDRSLFWLFNSLPSPSVDITRIADRHSRFAAEHLLSAFDRPSAAVEQPGESVNGPDIIPNLKAILFSYQARTVAAMIQSETSPRITLDPRYEERKSPNGSTYYYNARELLFRRSQPQFEGNKGGILAETMGVGKTVIIIALILATRFHLPQTPPQYTTTTQSRPTVGRLTEMAITKAGRFGVPLKSHLHRLHHGTFLHLEAQIDSIPIHYEIPYHMRRSNRMNSVVPPPRKLRLCSTSIIVVPRNLLRQWQAELNKHANIGHSGLRVLVLEKSKDVLPSVDEISAYDILLFSKTRFEQEAKDGMDDKARSTSNVRAGCQCPYIGATRIRDCTCLRLEDVYCSPLKNLHFLRIIIDEGHEFSSTSSNAVRVATTLVTAERRWIVSGTPAKERLFGVDIELTGDIADNDEQSQRKSKAGRFSSALADRQLFVRQEELNGASKSLGVLLANFLRVRPWAGTEDEQRVEWEDFAFRHETFKGRTHTAFSQCMVSTLNALVLKTRPEDVEKDVILPPLHVSVKMLEPSYYDVLTLNLFNFFIMANAVTSERTDVDYLFHKNSTASRHSLVRNLRASPFFWTAWAESDVLSAIGHSERYMAKEGTLCSSEDKRILTDYVAFAKKVLESEGWKAMAQTHELAMYVQKWPDDHRETWSLDHSTESLLVGASQLHAAQKFVNGRLFDENPLENLIALGQVERERAFTVEEKEQKTKDKEGATMKNGIPASGMREKQFDSRQHASPKKSANKGSIPSFPMKSESLEQATLGSPGKRKRNSTRDTRSLPEDSPLAQTSVIGTVSSKLSYLLSRIMVLHMEEKILVFYDVDNAAYYISQALDLFHVKHLIYARTLNVDQRSRYIVAFDTDPSIRVLLMDVSHGAWGLNVNKASRVFFLNPPCAPHTEAQAIKRAHRIGQTKEVWVETLVLAGTIEEAIWQRSRQMTREEHERAGREISNDSGMAKVIQDARAIPLPEDGHSDGGRAMMAKLAVPLQLFCREGRHDIRIKDIDQEVQERDEDQPMPRNSRKKFKRVVFVDGETSTGGNVLPSSLPSVQTIPYNSGSIFG